MEVSKHSEPFPRGRGGGLVHSSSAPGRARLPRRPTAHAHYTVLTVSPNPAGARSLTPLGTMPPKSLLHGLPLVSHPGTDTPSAGKTSKGKGKATTSVVSTTSMVTTPIISDSVKVKTSSCSISYLGAVGPRTPPQGYTLGRGSSRCRQSWQRGLFSGSLWRWQSSYRSFEHWWPGRIVVSPPLPGLECIVGSARLRTSLPGSNASPRILAYYLALILTQCQSSSLTLSSYCGPARTRLCIPSVLQGWPAPECTVNYASASHTQHESAHSFPTQTQTLPHACEHSSLQCWPSRRNLHRLRECRCALDQLKYAGA